MLVAAINSILPLLLLACPIGMGLMMWFMSKGMKSGQGKQSEHARAAGTESLAELRTVQARLAAQIDAAESDRDAAERAGTRA